MSRNLFALYKASTAAFTLDKCLSGSVSSYSKGLKLGFSLQLKQRFLPYNHRQRRGFIFGNFWVLHFLPEQKPQHKQTTSKVHTWMDYLNNQSLQVTYNAGNFGKSPRSTKRTKKHACTKWVKLDIKIFATRWVTKRFADNFYILVQVIEPNQLSYNIKFLYGGTPLTD